MTEIGIDELRGFLLLQAQQVQPDVTSTSISEVVMSKRAGRESCNKATWLAHGSTNYGLSVTLDPAQVLPWA
jgi:hypothetical protein